MSATAKHTATGKRAAHRPAYEDMCADISAGIVNRVVVWDLDRLYREPRELEDLVDLCDQHGVDLASVGGDVDLSSPSGRMFARMKGTVAKYECEQKSARQRAANRKRAENGKAWNVRAFGYDGNKLVQAEADAIRQASLDLIDGATLYGIAADWNKAGLTTPKGYLWSGTSVREVLTRARNAGLAVHDVHGAARANRGKSLKERISAAILEGKPVAWPAIVDRATFDAVLTTLSNPERHSGKKQARAYLLSGLAYCELCGRRMGTGLRMTKKNTKRPVYQCKWVGCGKVTRDLAKTDALVVDNITTMLASPDATQLFARGTVDTQALSAQASKFRGLISAAEREYDEGDISGRDLKRRRDNLQAKIDAIDAQLVGSNTSRKLDGLMGNPDARAVFEGLTLDRQRAIVDTVCTVTIKPNPRDDKGKIRTGGAFDPELIVVQRRED